MKAILTSLLSLLISASAPAGDDSPLVVHDAAHKTISISDEAGSIRMRVSYDSLCLVDRLRLMDREVLSPGPGAGSQVVLLPASASPRPLTPFAVSVDNRRAVMKGISFDGGITETWTFEPLANGVKWRIDRVSPTACPIDYAWSPNWIFPDSSAWTAALLGNGGVAWFALFDSAHATYGVHTSDVLLWKKGEPSALRIAARSPSGDAVAARFTRRKDNGISLAFSLSPDDLRLKHDAGSHRRRYLPAREDIWAPYEIPQGAASVEYRIQCVDFKTGYDPGTLPPFNAREIQTIANTVARLGVIDSRLHGSNSWRTPYGPVCLHEPFIAQLGLIVQDTNYFNDYAQALDYYRDHAIMPDGRVKPRWAYTGEDAIPGTCDSLGFYEARWGYLLDSNPDYVTNVAELFDFTGNQTWLRGQKAACERALEYLLKRDADRDGLVEMMTDTHLAAKGSDWIDVIWASHENAFVNAKLYYALTLWSDIEQMLGDRSRADEYRARAMLLKKSFNRTTDEGGFWNPLRKWYVHWRDKDNSIHGDNLVTFVNFMAIAYGLCDDPERSAAILKEIETQMSKENLFFWPICMFPYQPDEGLAFQFPFPSYENGDIFLSLGEVGTRAYLGVDPAIPLRYIKKVVARFEKDGLAYQRYLRKTQQGAGDDILAGNAFPIVGLYRDIYGIQPKYNRLYIEPHITSELSGTLVKYRLRGQVYGVTPYVQGGAKVATSAISLYDIHPFGIDCNADTVRYFRGMEPRPSMSVTVPHGNWLDITIQRWDNGNERRWIEQSAMKMELAHTLSGLLPTAFYTVLLDGETIAQGTSDANGSLGLTYTLEPGRQHTIELTVEN